MMSKNNNNTPHVGFQSFVELYGCPSHLIDDPVYIEQGILEVASKLNMTVVESVIHRFNPIGVSGVVIIQESHIAVHTWPEFNYVALDFFTCNQAYNIEQVTSFLKEKFSATTIELQNIQRGELKKIHQYQSKKIKHVR